MLPEGVRRFLRLPGGGRTSEEIEDEIELHLELRAGRLEEMGLSPEAARVEARRRFGSVSEARRALRREAGRRDVRLALRERVAGLSQDVRHTFRGFRRSPGYAVLAIFTLAIGIGVTTAVFGLANWVLLRPLPQVSDPDRLVTVQMRSGMQGTGISVPNLHDLESAAPAFSSLAGHAGIGLNVAAPDADPEALQGEAVTADYLSTLGTRPQLGRQITPEEAESPSPSRVALISDDLWRSMYGAAPDVVGRRIGLNGSEFEVIGVLPPGFRGTERFRKLDVWVPISAYALLRHFRPGVSFDQRDRSFFNELVGRLRPGASAAVAEAQLRARMLELVAEHPDANGIYGEYLPSVEHGIGLSEQTRERTTATLRLMLGFVLVLLLIACSNVANLLLLRGLQRRGEMAVRRALGASRLRLLRAHMVEGVVLGLAGGALGVVLSAVATLLFRGQGLLGLPAVEGLPIDWRVLAFALGVALSTGIVFGLVPALAARRDDTLTHLKEAAPTGTAERTWLRRSFTVTQIAAAMVLLVGAALLARTLHRLHEVDLGFDPGVLTVLVNPGSLGYTPEQLTTQRAAFLERVREIPGVQTAALVTNAPFSSGNLIVRLHRDADEKEGHEAVEYFVSDGYFRTLGIPILAGRQAREPLEMVVSEPFARSLWGDASPLGRTLVEKAYDGTISEYTVVGVAAPTRVENLRDSPDPIVYLSIANALEGIPSFMTWTTILVRSALPRARMETLVAGAIHDVDPAVPVIRVETVSEGVQKTIAEERILGRLITTLALLAAVLAAIGLYAVVSYATAQRTREIGIRVALGAPARAVVRLVAREAGAMALAGIALGILAAVWLTRLIESRLFGIEPLDPLVYAGSAAVFVGVVAAASWRPARRAVKTDPVEALREL